MQFASIEMTSKFMQFVCGIVADLKSKEIACIDLELLNLKRTQIRERFEDYKKELAQGNTIDKGKAQQDLISRGFGNSTVLPGELRAIDRQYSDDLDKATRELCRSLEEIALLEKRRMAEVGGFRRFFRKILNNFRKP